MRFVFFWACLALLSPWAAALTCVPTTCTTQGATCGSIGDGCGGVVACGSCGSPQTCGGGGSANVCGVPAACTGLCLKQQTCAHGDSTISGTVYMPNGTLPLPNALVYIPNAALPPFPPSVGCSTCATPPTSAILVKTVSGPDGKFVLRNVPVGSNIPLVVQAGRWRRQTVLPSTTACADTAVSATLTRLPRSHSEGDIPQFAVVTAAADAQECLLRAVGINDAEFSNPSGTGRVQFFTASGSPGAIIDTNTPDETHLFGTASGANKYDAVVFGCQGNSYTPSATELGYFLDYVNSGGRAMLDHFSYTWLHPNGDLDALTDWDINQTFGGNDPQTATINTAFPKGATLSQWLTTVGATSTPGQIVVSSLHHDYDSVSAPEVNWLTSTSPAVPQQLGFNTPVTAAPAQQCGRISLAENHLYPASAGGVTFPGECGPGTMTPQQKLAAYSLFDTTNCVQSDAGVSNMTVYAGDRQSALPGQNYTYALSAQVIASDGTNLMGIPVSFTVVPDPSGTSGSFLSSAGDIPSDPDGVATAPALFIDPSSPIGKFTVTASEASGQSATFTLFVGDLIFADGFE